MTHMAKPRLGQIAQELQGGPKPRPKAGTSLTVNPERGERGGFLKVTVTLPVDLLTALRTEGLRRRAEGQKDTGVSELIREAVADLLTKASSTGT